MTDMALAHRVGGQIHHTARTNRASYRPVSSKATGSSNVKNDKNQSPTGVVAGTVTNMMTGKGQFQVNYMGEVLTGEATRVSNDERRGVASAYSPRGTFMSCEYQMSTPYQGAGTCVFSNGAKYQLHVGGN